MGSSDDLTRNAWLKLLIEPPRFRLLCAYALAVAACAFAYLRVIDQGNPVFFPDDYLRRSTVSLLDAAFYTGNRPFTTHLFYKLCGSDPGWAVLGNRLLSTIGWTLLGLAIGTKLRIGLLAFVAVPLFASASLWWNVAGWSRVMLSEPVALWLFPAWYASMVFLESRGGRTWRPTLAATFFFSFTKDSVAFFLLGFSLLAVLLGLRSGWNEIKRREFPMLAFVLVVFGMQTLTSRIGNRHLFPLLNVMLQRVLPNEEKSDWFQRAGAPIQRLKMGPLEWEGAWASSHEWALFANGNYIPFKNWVQREGVGAYGRFLLFHPMLTLSEAWRNRQQIYAYDLTDYTGPPPRSLLVSAAGWLWRPARIWLLLAASLTALALWALKKCSGLTLAISLGLAVNGILTYHADAMEVQRHCLLVAVGLTAAAFHQILTAFDFGFQQLQVLRKG